jgi:hypothetical protein
MNDIVKKRLIIYLLIFLVIINLTALLTFLYFKWSADKPHGFPPGNRFAMHRCISEFCKNELNLSKDQMIKFQKIKSDYHSQANIYIDSLELLRKSMFEELALSQPDKQKLNKIANDIGRLTVTLKLKTIDHFLAIRSICTPEQQKKYFDFIMSKNSCGPGPEHGPGPGPKMHECMDSSRN